jgi:hypothetical protein
MISFSFVDWIKLAKKLDLNFKMEKSLLTLLILIVIGSVQSCSSDDDGGISTALIIGDFYEGGVIFYLDATGEHGLISALVDQSFEAEWGCQPTVVNGANSIVIGTGEQNTLDIIGACNSTDIAASLCSNLVLNDYSDWFLASKDELNELYKNRGEVNETALVNGGDKLEDTEYWSSSHDASNTVFIQSFIAGNVFSDFENGLYNVRARRSF